MIYRFFTIARYTNHYGKCPKTSLLNIITLEESKSNGAKIRKKSESSKKNNKYWKLLHFYAISDRVVCLRGANAPVYRVKIW